MESIDHLDMMADDLLIVCAGLRNARSRRWSTLPPVRVGLPFSASTTDRTSPENRARHITYLCAKV